MAKKNQRRGRKPDTIARWNNRTSGTATIVVPYPGVLISTGSSTFQSQVQLLWGSTSSVLYSVPIWLSYAGLFPLAKVSQVRVTYTPHASQTVTNWQGSGLAGFFSVAPGYILSAPTTNLISFRQECSTARSFYPGRSYRATFSTKGNAQLSYPLTTNNVSTPNQQGVTWGYAIEGNPSPSGTILGVLLFEFLVHFYHT